MLKKNSNLSSINNVEIFKFWNKILENFPIQIMNNKEWSMSHMNIKTKERKSLRKKLKKVGIQTSFGANYLSHNLKPYQQNNLNNNFPNAINHLNQLVQLPINLSHKNYNKLMKKEKNIVTVLERIFN